MSQINTLTKLAKLMKKPIFSSAEARKAGVHPRLLSYYAERGILERVGRGIYRALNEETGAAPEWEELALTAASIPNSVICLISALGFYGYTDEFMRNHWIAVPHQARNIKRPRTRIVRMRNTRLGRETIHFGRLKVNIFDRERTVLDAFRYLGKEAAIKALRAYLKPSKGRRADLLKLQDYARRLKVPIGPYLLSLTT
jgi:predicted transcriptional regulator of viral defense system